MSEKIENSLSENSGGREDVGGLKEQVLDLQNALQDAYDTIKDMKEKLANAPAPGNTALWLVDNQSRDLNNEFWLVV